MINDQELWQGMMQGDKEMFLALYKKYYHCLLFVGLKEIKDSQLVKDTIQQLYLYLWEKRETLGAAKNVKSYIITSFLRKLTVDWEKSNRAAGLHGVCNIYSTDPKDNPEENLINKDEQRHLFKLLMNHINELPNRQKELIILKFYEGLSYQEIVLKTGLSHRTVYNKIHEALKRLKLDMATHQYSPTQSAALELLVSVLAASSMIAAYH